MHTHVSNTNELLDRCWWGTANNTYVCMSKLNESKVFMVQQQDRDCTGAGSVVYMQEMHM